MPASSGISAGSFVAVGAAAAPAALPVLIVVQGQEERTLPISRSPFTIGRKTDRDLVIADPRVSREHAQILLEGNCMFIQDLGSKHGTFVNGQRVSERRQLSRNDRLDFGAEDAAYAIFDPERHSTSGVREFLSQMSGVQIATPGAAGDLEKMKIFLEAARKLNTTGVLDEVLVTLIEATLRLTRAERGYVFLVQPDGTLRLAAGRNSRGEMLLDDKTISHSTLDDALKSSSEFLVTDTSKMSDFSARNSIMAYDLRTVIAIPLKRPQVQRHAGAATGAGEISGVLYLDSRFASREVSVVSHDILRAIATEAAALVENAHLVQAESEARAYQQELAIAADIQQRLMTVSIPDVPFASVKGRNLPCKEIGGDFFDVMQIGDSGLGIVLCDVSGKGVSAALLGSILQGMVYSQLGTSLTLDQIVDSANRFLCQKILGEKYATIVIGRLRNDGELEFINCGHVQPVVISAGGVRRETESNLPVGLLPFATYASSRCRLSPGDRFLLVTDGVTEAENCEGEMFGNERLEQAASGADSSSFENVFEAVHSFCGSTPLNDDCTVLEVAYRGAVG
ncbi:MAG: SpoIIE family protein phosphatase [Acidobacteria bacterium]|nr:SpoIIE family protein phosphatase [Acidobacteriota bacterium]